VPHRTYPAVNAPWVPAGNYTVRLTANGKTSTQPLTVHLDPRVKTPPLGLTTLNSLTHEMYSGARKLRQAAEDARVLTAQLESAQGPEADAMKKTLAEIAPAAPAGGSGRGGFGGGAQGGGRGGRGGGPAAAPTLDGVSGTMMAAAMAMQAADTAPTGREVAACAEARRQATAVTAKWTKVSTVDLATLNATRKAAGQPAITIVRR
jgi:hypothetical protein